jgi:Fic family protein
VAAAVALVACGVAIGVGINREQAQRNSMLALQQQLNEMKTLMMQRIDDRQSASQRMLGVSVALEFDRPDDEIIGVLVKTLNEDGNTNVRLAALEALSKFSNEDKVRKALIEALRKQKDPVVQIALIQLMVKMKENSIKNELKKIVDDQEVIQPVKDEAYSGLLKLS